MSVAERAWAGPAAIAKPYFAVDSVLADGVDDELLHDRRRRAVQLNLARPHGIVVEDGQAVGLQCGARKAHAHDP